MTTGKGTPPAVRITARSRATIAIAIGGRIEPQHVTELCAEVCSALQGSIAKRVICDLGDATAADAVAVDALARLQLAAHREDRTVELRNASPELLELLELAGLEAVLPVAER